MLVLSIPAMGIAQEADSKTHKVKAEHFKIDVEVEGVVESASMQEISVDTESWTDLKIKKVIEEGSSVSQGDTILWFETESIDKSLEEKKYALQLSKYGLQELELTVDGLAKTLSLDQALAERTMQHAKEDYDYFNDVERPMSEKSAQNSLKSSQWQLENSQEEFSQLEQMYTEDELTEESEAIVLKRARRSVEQAEFWLERQQQTTKRTLETSLPRSATTKKDELERQELNFEKSKITLPMTLEKKKIELDKTKFSLDKAVKSLADLEADRTMMEIKAPANGILYHGKCVRGKWSGSVSAGNRQLKEGGAVSPKKTIMTIVDPSNVFIRCDLAEAHLGSLKLDMGGKATLVAYPDNKFNVSVGSISYIPISAGKFDCTFKVNDQVNWMPGMSCKVKIRIYENANALTVPSSAVFTDDDSEYYVYVKRDDENERLVVTRGKSHGTKTEITAGLRPGDEVLLKKP